MEEKRMSINETKQYSMFKHYGHNREIDENRVKKLMASIKADGLIQPIIVTNDLHIIDGQHRLSSCIKLGIPVWYVVNNFMTSEAVTTANNTQKAWSRHNWIHHHAAKGSADYKRLIELVEEAEEDGFTENIACEVYNKDSGQTLKRLKEGTYKVDETNGGMILDYAEKMSHTHLGKKAFGTKFVRALAKVYIANNNMSIDNLIRKTAYNKINTSFNNESDIVSDIIDCYNYRLHQDKKISI